MKKFLILIVALAVAGLTQAQTPIDSTNNVGFISVSSGTNVSIITVPFEQCLGSGSAGMLSDLVSTNGLISHSSDPAQADQLVVLTTNTSGQAIYYYYWLSTGAGWMTNVTKLIGGTQTNIASPAASAFPVARGIGFWIKRPGSAGGAVNLYMKGQIPVASQPITLKPGLTLLGLGALVGKDLNDAGISWGSRYGGDGLEGMDSVIVVGADGTSFNTYLYDSGTGKWITEDGDPASVTIQPGCGFWYFRGGSTNLSFTPVVP